MSSRSRVLVLTVVKRARSRCRTQWALGSVGCSESQKPRCLGTEHLRAWGCCDSGLGPSGLVGGNWLRWGRGRSSENPQAAPTWPAVCHPSERTPWVPSAAARGAPACLSPTGGPAVAAASPGPLQPWDTRQPPVPPGPQLCRRGDRKNRISAVEPPSAGL